MSLLNPPIFRQNNLFGAPQTIAMSTINTSGIFGAPPTINTTFLSPGLLVSNIPIVEVNTGLNENPFAQEQVTRDIHLKLLDKWLYDELCHLLRYMKYSNGKVTIVSTIKDYKLDDSDNETNESIEAKADFIEENILTLSDVRRTLTKLSQLGMKWYDFSSRQYASVVEPLVIKALNKVIRRKFKSMIPDADKDIKN